VRPRKATHGHALRSRVYLLMATGVFFPLALMAGVGWYWLHSLDDRLLSGRLAVSGAVAAHFDEELTGDLEALQRLGSLVSGPLADGKVDELRTPLRDIHQYFRHRESVYLLDAAGRMLIQEPPENTPAGPRATSALVDEVIASGRPRLSGLVAEERGRTVHELVPVRGWDGKLVGVAGGVFDPTRRGFDRMLKQLRRGQTGLADLVDGSGLVLASTAPGRVGQAVECRAHLAQLIREKRPETAECSDCHRARGVEAAAPDDIVIFTPLAAASWGVRVRQSAAEALPTEGAVPWAAVGGILLLQFALAGVFAWGAARSVTQPVAVLTAEAERIAGGELAWPIPDLGEDEVGRLGKALDRMRQSLRELLEHVAGANEQLEQRVAARTQELNEANERLRERETARSELLRKVITAQEDERKRIARELHDETSQSLAVLAMGLGAAVDAIKSGKTPRLDEVKAVAVRTLEDVHRLILDLRPSVLDDLGLVSAIRWYAERHLETRGISVRCEFGDVPRLPPEMETALFRICQETMSNVARHAQASAVLIQVGVEGGELHVEIEDDGKGFDPGAQAKRERRPWGLMGIRERAEIFGGTARIDSSPGQGTRVEVRLPVPLPEKEGAA